MNLLEQATRYAFDAVSDVKPELMGRPTPCAGWDLTLLLAHLSDSLAALNEGAAGRVSLCGEPDQPADLVTAFRERATEFLCAAHDADPHQHVNIAERSLTVSILTAIGTVEVAVHGWDVSQACGRYLPIPGPLARGLLDLCVLFVPPAGRYPMFAPPVPVPPAASPSDQLVAFLGRVPDLRCASPN